MQPTVETLRRELAAAFRLAAKHEFNEGVCNHFSVALPGREERYLINPYGIHWCEMQPSDLLMIDGAGQVLEGEGEVEATAFEVENIKMAYVFYESGLSINVMYGLDEGGKRAVGFKLSEGMDIPEELSSFKFARQKSKLAGTIRGSYFVIKNEH